MKKNSSAKKTCIESVETRTGCKLPDEVQLEHQVAILEATSDFVGYADARTRQIIYINQAGRKMTGLTKDEDVTKLKISDVHPDWTNQLFDKEILPTAIREGEWNGECAFRNRDGREIPVTMVLIAHKSINGEVERFSTISRNITERRREEALRESEATSRALIDAQMDSVLLLDARGMILDLNKVAAERLGKGRNELINTCADNSLPKDVARRRRSLITQIFETGRAVRFEDERDGIWYDTGAYPILDKDGAINMIAVIARDITERRREEALKESEERYRNHVEGINDVAYAIGSGGEITYISPVVRNLLGYEPEEMTGRHFLEFVHQEDHDLLKRKFSELSEGLIGRDEYRVIGKHGDIKWVRTLTTPIIDIEGFAGGRGILVDMTERKQAEEALRVSEQKYRLLFELESDALFLVETDTGCIMEVNAAASALYGYSREELLSMKNTDVSAEPELTHQKTKEEATRVPIRYHRKKNGVVFPVEITASIFCQEGRQFQIAAIRDITERKNLETQLIQAQKMEAMGMLAGGIAHDFNNILASIIGYTELTLEGLEDELLREDLFQVLKGCGRAKDLIRQILTFSRRTDRDKRPVELRLIVKEALKLMRSSLPTTIEIRQALGDTPLHVMADPMEIHQVMMNLCINASHAMREKGGVVHVELCRQPLEEHMEHLFPGTEPADYVKLTVSDTGHGIARAIMDRIFDPFFTTKGSGEGTGLGLSVVYGIVKSHEGVVHVESEPGQGTAFNVYLPLIQEVSSPARAISAVNPTGTERIIFVDDEQAIVTYSEKVLASLGYQVTATTSSEEALELFRTHPDRFDLVIADMTMPKITGAVLSGALLEIRPDIPIILCSGFSEGMSEEKARAIGVRKFLMKPLNRSELAVVIREILDEGKSN